MILVLCEYLLAIRAHIRLTLMIEFFLKKALNAYTNTKIEHVPKQFVPYYRHQTEHFQYES